MSARAGVVVIDVRRHFACGIGRVGLNAAAAAMARRDAWDRVVLLTTTANRSRVDALADGEAEVLTADYPFFSKDDLYALPRLVERLRADIYVAPQFYISPFIECPTVKMVHDLWPILHDRWLPSRDEVIGHFGNEARDGVHEFLRWFDDNRETLPSWQERRVRDRYEADAHPVRRYALAMYCATVDTAVVIPTCSAFSAGEIAGIFPHAAKKLRLFQPFVTLREPRPRPRRFAFLHVGKFEPRKNQRLVCESFLLALESLSPSDRADASLVLVGDVSYRREGREIATWVESKGRSNPIAFAGIASEEELWQRYDSAYGFVFPSAFEGFGIPILEAMSASVPVITANRGGTREAAGAAALLVDELTPDAVADAMLRLWNDETLYTKLVARGRHRARAFSFERMAQQFAGILDEAMAAICV